MDPADAGRRAMRVDSGHGTGFPRDVGRVALCRTPGARLADGVQVVCPGRRDEAEALRGIGAFPIFEPKTLKIY